MSIRLILAAVAALAVAAPAVAQDAAPPAPPAAAAPAPSPEDLAIQAKAMAFSQMIQTMAQELTAAPSDAAADAVVAQHQPQIDAFAADVDGYFAAGIAKETDPAKKAEMETQRAQAATELHGLSSQMRTQIRAQAAAPAAPPAAQ